MTAIAPVLRETAKRGLIYVDDGASPRSLAGQIAGAGGLPFAKAELTLDSAQGGPAMDKALARLEALAKEQGELADLARNLSNMATEPADEEPAGERATERERDLPEKPSRKGGRGDD